MSHEVQIWRPDGLPGVEILHENNATRLHTLYFGSYVISAAVNVATEVQYQRQNYLVTNRSVHLGEPGEVYKAIRQYHQCSVQVLQLDSAFVYDAAYELGMAGQPHFRFPITWDEDTYVLLRRFHRSLTDSKNLLEQQTRVTELLRLLLTNYTEAQTQPALPSLGKAAIYRARDYLHAFWDKNITLDELAQAVHHSKSYVADSFRHEFGIPPHTYQIHLRIAHARLLLAQGQTISHVATITGFADQAHLTRYFKRVIGITPAVFAQNRKIVQDSDSKSS